MVTKKRKGTSHAKAKKKSKKANASSNEGVSNEPQVEEATTMNEDETPEPSILSEELRMELGGVDSDVLVVVDRKSKSKTTEKETISMEEKEEITKLSKRKQKKLAQLAARKVKEARREGLYQSLEQHKLPSQALQLMYTSSKLGHKETLKERLKRSINLQKAGLKLTEEAQNELVQTTRNSDAEEEEDVKMDDVIEKESVVVSTVESTNDQLTTNKNKRRRVTCVTSIVPMLSAEEQNERVRMVTESPPDTSTPPVSLPLTSSLHETVISSPLTSLPPISSQNDAMARLEALRRKNEERRQHKKAVKTQQPEVSSTTSTPAYIPKTIPLQTTAQMINQSTAPLSYKTTLVQLHRVPAIQLARMQLPVCSAEQEVMEAISTHDVVILCGETGSGKTTQVPQFLYEAGYGHPQSKLHRGRIGVTQPRRVAAVSTAQRVAHELNVGFGGTPRAHVGYQIRYDANHVSDSTRIKFMTDGILLKEIQHDFLLRDYSIILLDEAHERNVNTDILIGLLSRIAPLRAQLAKEEAEALADDPNQTPLQPLKLVIMSATLRVEDFTQNKRLFPIPPPVIKVEARQYPVTIHFNKRTELDDYVGAAYEKITKIHRKLPEGGILVFLTGQREIKQLCRKLRKTFSRQSIEEKNARRLAWNEKVNTQRIQDRILSEHDDLEEEADMEEAQLYEDSDSGSDSDASESDEDDESVLIPYMHILPLYSLLSNEEQMRVFDPVPSIQHRLVVIATNVAETSLTIPGIKYVVDAGRTKERVYDLSNGISSFQVQWISKASADQRAGRAGRTGPGHCYRLYSSAVYDTEFDSFSPPAIIGQPIEDLVLQMKAMGIHNILQFPFPTPPALQALEQALMLLGNLGAIETQGEAITPLGQVLVQFPIAARFAKMLLLAKEMHVLEYTIAIVAALSGHSPFITVRDRQENEETSEDMMEQEWLEAEQARRHIQWIDSDSDVLSLLRAAGAYAYAGASSSFCIENHLHEKTMQEMLQLRTQLTRIVNQMYPEQEIVLRPSMPPPDSSTQSLLRQIMAAGFLDQIAKRVPAGTITEGTKIERNCGYLSCHPMVSEVVYIHPHSHVFTPDPSKLPEYVVYQHIMRSTRAYMKTVTAIEPVWLSSIAQNTPLCHYSVPLAEPSPRYNPVQDEIECFVKVLYGRHQWPLPVTKMRYPETIRESEKDVQYDGGNRFKWFAKFLLDGQVIKRLESYAHGLREPSFMLIRKKYDKKIQLLVIALQQANVSTRDALSREWKTNTMFLYSELLSWYNQETQKEIKKEWKQIIA